MPATYTLISSNVLASSAASVTFSSIPATYTDLVLRVSARCTGGAGQVQLGIRFNSNSSAIYSDTSVRGYGAGFGSARVSGSTESYQYIYVPAGGATSNTFGNTEIYIPSYQVSQNKPFGTFSVAETNSSVAYMGVVASLFSNTSAITSLEISAQWTSAVDIASGSSFYLYGISNA